MDSRLIEARLNRMNDAFNKCVNGTREASIVAFGVDSFLDLIGKKFFFLIEDFYILNDKSDIDPNEALLGQVTGVKFKFLADGLDLPEGMDWKQYVSEAKTITELKGQTCFPFIQTTLGELTPPWDGGEWHLDPEDENGWDGSVVFL
jgi:hypothetical protein